MLSHENEILGLLLETFTQFDDFDTVQSRVIECLCTLVGATIGNLSHAPRALEFKQLSQNSYGPLDQLATLQKGFDAHFWSDPVGKKIIRAPQTAFDVEHRVGAEAFRGSAFYNQVLRPAGLESALALFLRSNDGRIEWVAGFAHAARRTLGYRQIALLEQIAPHVHAGLSNLSNWNERLQRAQACESLLDISDELLVCIALDAVRGPRLVTATHAARAALLLDKVPTGHNLPLRSLLQLAATLQPIDPRRPLWSAAGGEQYRLHIKPLREACQVNLRLLRLEPLAGLAAPAPEFLMDSEAGARAAGLSAREAGVFAQMSQGKSNRDIAAALGISIDTVRAHLRNMFVKLGVGSRLEALNAVRSARSGGASAGVSAQTGKVQSPSKFAKSMIDTSRAANNVSQNVSRPETGSQERPESTTHAVGIAAQNQ
jgi:DNA-binding CsgD family transcriptional regulator